MSAVGQWRATYAPGDWLVLCGPTSVVVIEPPGAGWTALVAELWREVVTSASLTDLAGRLARYGLDTMPSFGALFWTPSGMRSLVRGSVRLVDPATGAVLASGDGVQTWSEAGLGDLASVRIETGEADDRSPTDPEPLRLPLVVGAVRASSLVLDARPQARLDSPQLDTPQLDAPAPETPPRDEADGEDQPDALTTRTDPEPDLPATMPDGPRHVRESGAGLRESDDGVGAEATVPLADLVDGPLPPAPSSPAEAPPATSSAAVSPPATGAATVMAVLCPYGHPNPPEGGRCRSCGVRVADSQARPVPQPALATLRVSDGTSAQLDRPVLVGRAPSLRGEPTARLLTVPSPDHDISRTHLEIVPEGWRVLVRDLHSTNGTVLVAKDGSRRALPAGEAVPVALGSALELAEGVAVLLDLPQ